MGITHVIRAEEHLPNTPKQQLLWEALGATPPVWAHVPVIVNEKRQKLSKRRDKVALEAYRDEGYLAAAMRNYLMLLGWAPSGDREIVPWSVIEDGVPARGGQPRAGLLRRQEAAGVQRRLHPGARAGGVRRGLRAVAAAAPTRSRRRRGRRPRSTPSVFATVAPLAQTRIAVLSEIVEYVDFLFLDEPVRDEASWAKAMKDDAAEILDAAGAAFAALEDWSAEPLKAALEEVGAGARAASSARPRRRSGSRSPAARSGCRSSSRIEVLGRERTLARLRAARAAI